MELCAAKPRNQGKDPLLLRIREFRLEPDEAVHRPRLVFLAKLDHGKGDVPRSGIPQADRPHGTEEKRLRTPAGENLDGQARFEIAFLLEFPCRDDARRQQGGKERFVLGLRHREIQVIPGAGPVPVGEKPLAHVQGRSVHDGGNGVVEVEAHPAEQIANALRDRLGRNRAAGDDDDGAVRNRLRLRLEDPDLPSGTDLLRDRSCECFPVHRERLARGHPHAIGHVEEIRPERAQLRLEESLPGIRPVRTEGIAADEFGEPPGLVRRGRDAGAHLVQVHRRSGGRQDERRFGTGESGSDDLHPGDGEVSSGGSNGRQRRNLRARGGRPRRRFRPPVRNGLR